MARISDGQPVSFFHLFWRMGGWLTFIFALFLLFLTIISSSALSLADQFDQEGRETAAKVLDKYERVTTDSDGDREVTYYFQLAFQTSRGKDIDMTRSVGSGLYFDTEIGDFIGIWYLDSDPTTIEVSRGENRTASRITQVIALIFGISTLIAFWIPSRKAVAALRARRYGQRETATVTGLKRTSYQVNNRYRYRLTWKERSGRTGESLAYKEQDLMKFKPGQTITVYQGIKRAWWVGDIGERKDLAP